MTVPPTTLSYDEMYYWLPKRSRIEFDGNARQMIVVDEDFVVSGLEELFHAIEQGWPVVQVRLWSELVEMVQRARTADDLSPEHTFSPSVGGD